MIDKSILVIIPFLIISVLLAALLSMGAIPEIFKQTQLINQTLHGINRNTEQSYAILDSLKNKSADHYEMSQNMNQVQSHLDNITQEALDITKQHKQVQLDHDRIQENVNNVTQENQIKLDRYGENSIKKFDEILQKLEDISTKFDNLMNNSNR
jgi:uncharacterized protein (DUF342 family)